MQEPKQIGKNSQVATVQQLPDLLNRFCPELSPELPMIKSWLDKKLREYTEQEFGVLLRKALAEIVILTGGKMYDEATNRKMYELQLVVISKFLLGSFGHLSFSELKNAFYMNCEGKFGKVETHYGREINGEFLGSVLSAYMDYKKRIQSDHRQQLDEVLFPHIEQPDKVLTEKEYQSTYRETIEWTYQRFLKELELDELLFPDFFYSTLAKDGFIPENRYEELLTDAKNHLASQKHVEAIKDPENVLSINRHLRKLRMLRDNSVNLVSKQLAVKLFFLDSMDKGRKRLYEKVEPPPQST